MKYFKNAILHFKTITKHKIEVMKLLIEVGLIKQAILHDLSKYSFVEFATGIKYFAGTRSPNALEKEEKGYSLAWLHHKGRNKHHFEYWYDYSMNKDEGLVALKMPLKYVLEMVCDRIAASKIYYKENYKEEIPLKYYKEREKGILLHKDTKELLEELLTLNKEEGEKACIKHMKFLLKNKHIYENK